MADKEIEPAIEGVHWRKFPTWTGKERWFCMICDPTCDKIGYCDLGTMNWHLRDKHKKKAFNTAKQHPGGGANASGVQTRSNRGAGGSNDRKGTPVKETNERKGAATGPSKVPRKHPDSDATAFVAPKRRSVNPPSKVPRKRPDSDATAVVAPQKRCVNPRPSRKNDSSRAAEEELDVVDGTPEDWVPDFTNTRAHLHPHRHLLLPVCGLNSIAFKSVATTSTISQTFSVNWFQTCAYDEAAKCQEKEGNLDYVKFPICCNIPKEIIDNNIIMSPAATGPCNEACRKPPGNVENESDLMHFAPRPKKGANKDDGQVPLVNYSDESDGLD